MQVASNVTPNAYRNGGGNNLSLNTPSQSALDSSSNTLSPSSRDLRQQVVAIHKSTQVDSSTAQTKSTRLSLSLAGAFLPLVV